MIEFEPFPKVPRLSRECVVTEKIDGTNASVTVIPAEDYAPRDTHALYWDGKFALYAGSRKRFVFPEGTGPKGCDNFGFAAWVRDNAEDLVKLGPGTHYGEWWGKGIQRGYGLDERRFSLFNAGRWRDTHTTRCHPEATEVAPECCHVVPVLRWGVFDTILVEDAMLLLSSLGSSAVPGFYDPEGIMIYHTAAHQVFKKTFEADHTGKDRAA